MSSFNIPITLVFLFTSLAAFSQKNISDLEKDGFSGKVKEIKTVHYYIENGTRGKSRPVFIDLYLPNGRKTEHQYAYIDGMGFTKKCTSVFDEKANLVEESCEESTSKNQFDKSNNLIKSERYTKDGTLVGTTFRKFDEGNNEIECKVFYGGSAEPFSTQQYKYSEGRLIEALEDYSGSGDFTRTIYNYNAFSKLSEVLKYEKNVLKSSIKYYYDKSGNLIKEQFLDDKGVSWSTIRYTFDKNNNLISKKHYDNEGKHQKGLVYTAKYNEANQLIEFLESDEDGKYDRFANEYDKSGKLIKRTFYNWENKVSKISLFEYDKSDNVKTEKILRDSVETYVIEYEITYF